MSRTSGRIFGLDLLRVVAVLMVMVSHAGYRYVFGVPYGRIAIESFFVMSGFLIGEMLIREFKNGFTFSDLKIFWVKRWYRTLPLYYFVLFFKFFFLDDSNLGADVLYYAGFLQNNFYGIEFFPVSWTLVLEEWFYIIMPLIIFVLFRKGIPVRRFYGFVFLVVFMTVAARLAYGYFKTDLYDSMNGNIVLRFDAFIVGVGLAAIKVFNRETYLRLASWSYFLLGVVIMVGSQLFYYDQLGVVARDVLGVGATATQFIVADMGVFFILPFLCEAPIFKAKEGSKLIHYLTWLSLLSYPMYLIHLEVQRFVPDLLPFLYFDIPVLSLLTNTILTILISYVIYEAIHEPMIKLRSRAVKKMKAKAERKGVEVTNPKPVSRSNLGKK